MTTKLTLKLDKEVIEKAKAYAEAHQKSLSKLIEGYLQLLVTQEEAEAKDEVPLSPFVKNLCTGVQLPADLDTKKTYGDYLAEKYK
ncbi:DUF6364 family protein [Telluribacter sp.]|jgi:hypothetical protein|uniref:DUF6364 family protein n=1 Tax=Telluribacter sp. TaxID=1978767 RepID=UPI002E15817A|nr:DUF6364 family protein [Telluribacter sp.]